MCGRDRERDSVCVYVCVEGQDRLLREVERECVRECVLSERNGKKKREREREGKEKKETAVKRKKPEKIHTSLPIAYSNFFRGRISVGPTKLSTPPSFLASYLSLEDLSLYFLERRNEEVERVDDYVGETKKKIRERLAVKNIVDFSRRM